MMRRVPLELVPVADKTKAHNIRADFGGRNQIHGFIKNAVTIL
jgi:hypothetical protein